MVKEYFDKLSKLIKKTGIEAEIEFPTEVKDFFTGAAFHVDKEILVTLSPVGLAFKLPEKEVEKLIKSGSAIPLKYFPKGHIKKEYALFESPDLTNIEQWKKYILESIKNKTPSKPSKSRK